MDFQSVIDGEKLAVKSFAEIPASFAKIRLHLISSIQ